MADAALRYFELTGSKVFVIPIANTMPPMFVAAGELEPLLQAITSIGARNPAPSTSPSP